MHAAARTRPADNGETRRRGRRLGGFTLIEVLVVIAVIGLLISAILVVSTGVIRSQKRKATETLMRNLTIALDQFATDNPLGSIYDRKNRRTFGAYPPYQLSGEYPDEGGGVAASVREAVEPYAAFEGTLLDTEGHTLGNRFWRDLSAGKTDVGVRDDYALNIPTADDAGSNYYDNDIRALYTYLKLYGGDVLSQISESSFVSLSDPVVGPEFVNPTGTGTDPSDANASGIIDVFGIVDAWGVPLDYCLYVKLEWGLLRSGSPGWQVTDRVPVLRSRGVSQEVADANGDTSEDWILSVPFPAPLAHVSALSGDFLSVSGTVSDYNGWARAVGEGDNDPFALDERLFGYLPYEPE